MLYVENGKAMRAKSFRVGAWNTILYRIIKLGLFKEKVFEQR